MTDLKAHVSRLTPAYRTAVRCMAVLMIAVAFPAMVSVSAQQTAALTPLDQEIQRNIDQMAPALIALRRELHTYPELSNREVQTGKLIAERLTALKLDSVK